MKNNKKIQIFHYSYEKWKNLILFCIYLFYISFFLIYVLKGPFPFMYGGDYLGFWSVGKIADSKGYSEIYNLDILGQVQAQELIRLGFLDEITNSTYYPIPAPIFSIFVIPLQLLSKINLPLSYWLFTIINLAMIIAYLIFFVKKMYPEKATGISWKKILILLLASYPVFTNIFWGQVNFILVIFLGEFVRNAMGQKPFLSGLWLGGLLLKPQLLILVIPAIFILRYWKVLSGFIVSSGVVLLVSFSLSGITGMKSLINLWTKYTTGIPTNSPSAMINWRMIGVNLHENLNISIGWVIAGLGIVITLVAFYFLIKSTPPFGTPSWVVTMLGLFCVTLVITWHSHLHMSVVLLPFFAIILLHKLFSEKPILIWAILTPILLIGAKFVSGLSFLFVRRFNSFADWFLIALSGFIVNIIMIIITVRFAQSRNAKKMSV